MGMNNKYRREDSYHYNNDNYNNNYNNYDRLSHCYILLPKNYFNFITKNFSDLSRNIKKKAYDVKELNYNFKLPYYDEYIFKISAVKIYAKSLAIKIISECLFREMEVFYKNMTYLKLTILIPDNVIGFIIGIDGRNINSIREESRAKIEVFPKLNKGKFRKIDIYGSPDKIFRACERIFNIEEKYIHFNKNEQKNSNNNYNNNNNNYNKYNNNKYDYNKNKEQSFNISGIESSDKYNNNNRNFLDKKHYRDNSPDNRRREKSFSKNNNRSRSYSENKNKNNKNYSYRSTNTREEGSISENESIEEGMIKSEKSENLNSDNDNYNKINNDKEKIKNNNNTINNNNNKNENEGSSIDFIFEKNILEKIKNSKENFWNEFTKDYECKYIEKPCNLESSPKDSLVLLTLIGTPEQISKGIFYLQDQLITQFKDNN